MGGGTSRAALGFFYLYSWPNARFSKNFFFRMPNDSSRYHPVQGDYNNADEAASLSKEMHISHDENFTFIEQAYKDNKIVGIGEAGLDFTPKFVKKGEIDKNSQKEALIMQLNLAEKLNLPINLHSRSAGRPLMNIINEHENKKFHNIPCQFHAFAGKASLPNNFIKNDKNSNCYFSVGTSRIDLSPSKIEKKTSVRYKPNENFKFISGIPIRNLLLETDLPALGPVRGLRNEPENLLLAAEAVGKVFNLPMNKVRNLTSFNACKLYPKLRSVLF